MKRFWIVVAVVLTAPAHAYEQVPAPSLDYPFQRSARTPSVAAIPPYSHVFHLRAYNTPPLQPFYNVPPYLVVSPE